MGLLTKILFFPVTGPVAGIQWTLRKVTQVVDEELTDDSAIKEELMELQMQLELGDIDDEEYTRRETELMKRLRDVRAWRERLGKSVSGGPVRVSGGDESGGAGGAGGGGGDEES
jgi:hypothetical protein